MAISIESLPPPGWDGEGLDGLLAAFLPGRLSEIFGPRSSGGGSLLLALLSRATARGGLVALVDAADSLDPVTAARAGSVAVVTGVGSAAVTPEFQRGDEACQR